LISNVNSKESEKVNVNSKEPGNANSKESEKRESISHDLPFLLVVFLKHYFPVNSSKDQIKRNIFSMMMIMMMMAAKIY